MNKTTSCIRRRLAIAGVGLLLFTAAAPGMAEEPTTVMATTCSPAGLHYEQGKLGKPLVHRLACEEVVLLIAPGASLTVDVILANSLRIEAGENSRLTIGAIAANKADLDIGRGGLVQVEGGYATALSLTGRPGSTLAADGLGAERVAVDIAESASVDIGAVRELSGDVRGVFRHREPGQEQSVLVSPSLLSVSQ